jgi:hypothetical protein
MYDFYDIKEFPLVLGAVDGTLIPIKAPSVDEHLYVCRKGYHALNIICNTFRDNVDTTRNGHLADSMSIADYVHVTSTGIIS